MSLRDSNRRRRTETTLEITPLIDVVFLLLLFFLITATFSKQREAHIPVDLPEAASGKKGSEGESVTVYITKSGSVELRGDVDVQGDSLDSKLDYLKKNYPDAKVMLKGDQDASHGKIIDVLDQIKGNGFERVNLMISEPNGRSSSPNK